MMIPLGKKGRIVAGEHQGWHIEVVHEEVDTGGFYIFTIEPAPGITVYDYWFLTLGEVEGQFQYNRWIIEWISS